jgi:threonine dehydrogenase-like Zn-dependent dehydrogenase
MKGLVISAEWKPKDGYQVTLEEEHSGMVRRGNMVLHNPTLAVADRPDPVLASDHDVIVRDVACGICGADIHLTKPDADGYLNMPAPFRVPIAIGHEYAGEVVEVGSAVTRVKPGDMVAVEAQVNCGKCRACLRGFTANCEFLLDRGFTLDGGTAELSVAHERNCWPLTAVAERYGERHAYDVGALVEPASVVYNNMINRAGGFRPGDTVAVFGCGPIGLAAVGLACALGAGQVLAVDLAASKREIASILGASDTFDPVAGDAAQWLLERTKGVGVDMIVDATGAGRIVMPIAVAAIAVGGKIASIGGNFEPVEVDTLSLMFRSASVFYSLGHLGGGFPAVIALHAAGRLDLTKMITGRFGLDDGVAAMDRAHKGLDAKLLIHPQGLAGDGSQVTP